MKKMIVLMTVLLVFVAGCSYIQLNPEQEQSALIAARIAARSIGQEIAAEDYAPDVRWVCKRIIEINADSNDNAVKALTVALLDYLETSPLMRANLRDVMQLVDIRSPKDTKEYITNLQLVAAAILEGMGYAK